MFRVGLQGCLLLVLLGLAPGAAGADTEDVAEAAVAAHASGDADKLAALAAPHGGVDPWRVLDRLIELGKPEVAKAYAAAAKGKDRAAMPAYAAAWADKPLHAPSREALAAAQAAVGQRDLEGALAALARVGASAHPILRVRALQGQAGLHQAGADLKRASEAWRALAELAVDIGWLNVASGGSQRAGLLALQAGDYRTARKIWLFRVQIEKRRDVPRAIAAAQANVGLAHWRLGNLPRALNQIQIAGETLRSLGRRGSYGRSLLNVAQILLELGDWPRALSSAERARRLFEEVGDRRGLLAVESVLASTYGAMSDFDRARAHYEKAFALATDPIAVASLKLNAATLAMNQGRLEESDALLAAAGAVFEARKATKELMVLHAALGDLRMRQGRNTEALGFLQKSIAAAESTGDRSMRIKSRGSLAVALHRVGKTKEAKEAADRAAREAERLRSPHITLGSLTTLAWMRFVDGEHEQSIGVARRAIPHFKHIAKGHGHDHGTSIRGTHTRIYEIGSLAAAATGNAAEACYFLEGGRAGALLDAMGGREVLRMSLPETLIEAETIARRQELQAGARYGQAVARGKRREIKAAAEALDQARAAVQRVIADIQRHEKEHARTPIFYPTPVTVEEIQDNLEPGEVFVTYGLFREGSVALIVAPAAARVLSLGPTTSIEEACATIDFTDPTGDVAAPLARIRALVVEPLGLGKEVTRVHLSPHGALSFLPGSLLFPGRDVVNQASATTHAHLRENRPLPGKRVLALGDPVYRSAGKEGATRDGRNLPALPSTRGEVKAVGDVVLLGKDATPAALTRETRKHEGRWRAVHFACHGLIDPRRPKRSSLALSASEEASGALMARDVFRMQIPTDLAVLSACETGRGKVETGEGLVGLTHGFFNAGASGVLVSLWKVDDEATRALMLKFYERWSPKSGTRTMAAEALREARAHVRAQPKWKHPYYWGAWVLWGLPD